MDFYTLLIIFAKMILASTIGFVIGFIRDYIGKDAGMRTHSILCLASCSITILVQFLIFDESARVIAGILQGIGFLGGGVIFFSEQEGIVRGLTSSVIIWLTAIIGIICGTDYWLMVIPLLICLTIITIIGRYMKNKYNY